MLLALAAALALPRVAAADEFAEVQALLESLDYDAAVARLEPIVADTEREPRDRLRALELIAVARVGAGRDEDARTTFVRLRSADPGCQLQDPSYSPKIRRLFLEATPETPTASAELRVSLGAVSEREVLVHVEADPARLYVSELEVGWRWTDSGDLMPARLGRRAAAEGFPIPRVAGAPGVARLRLVATAYAPSGAVVASAGSEAEPLVLDVRPPVEEEPEAAASPSILTRWWLWAGVGVVVVGGVVAAIAVTSSGDDRAVPTLGTQRMR